MTNREFLALAEACGATLTGKPDGSESVTVVFTPLAWQTFSAAQLASKPGKRIVELDLNETGFLCNMIMTAYMASNPPRDAAGNMIMPTWLHELYQKLATANDEMMAEKPQEEQPSRIILPNHIKRH